MNIRPFLAAFLLAPAALAAPLAAAAGFDTPAAAQADALFADIFGGKEEARPAFWVAAHRALASSSFGQNEAGYPVYGECLQILSEDGNCLTTYHRTRRVPGKRRGRNAVDVPGGPFRMEVKVQKAIVPFVFMSCLRSIVDRKDERADIDIWEMDTDNRRLLRIRTRYFNLDREEVVDESIRYENKD